MGCVGCCAWYWRFPVGADGVGERRFAPQFGQKVAPSGTLALHTGQFFEDM